MNNNLLSISSPTRLIEIPVGKLIFMPIINWLSLSGSDGSSDKDLYSLPEEKDRHGGQPRG